MNREPGQVKAGMGTSSEDGPGEHAFELPDGCLVRSKGASRSGVNG